MNFSSALVTGANGFIGRALVQRLSQQGCAVTALVRRADAVFPHGVQSVVADCLDATHLAERLAGRECQVVFHLAAYGVTPGDRDTAQLAAVNVAGTGAVVEAAALLGAKAAVYAGSCSEYASAEQERPIEESHAATHDNLYGASKAAGGLWGSAVAQQAGLSFCWMRLFGVYGPGEAAHRLIPYLVDKLRRNETVDLTPGRQMRDLMFIDDAVSGLIAAADVALAGNAGPFNLCTGEPVSIGEVALTVADVLDRPRQLLAFGARPYRPDEALWVVGAPDRFRSRSGFLPQVSLSDGIRRSVAAL
jgi:UDP-glucose 4-epimerase